MVVVPLATPVTTPVTLMVAMPGLTLLHTPPASPVASARVMFAVGHTTSPPVIAPAFGSGFTVTAAVAAAVPQLLVTV